LRKPSFCGGERKTARRLKHFSAFSTMPVSFLPGNAGYLIMAFELAFVKQNLRSGTV